MATSVPVFANGGKTDSIEAFRRPDGSVGIRNHLLVLGINGLALRAAEKIARAVAGTVCVATPNGRGHVEPDLSLHLAQLAGLGCNGNVGAALVVGVDEAGTTAVADAIAATGKPVGRISFAEMHEDVLEVVAHGIRRAAALALEVSTFRRETVPLGALTIGVECGHSDATSGLVSNPVVGCVADRLGERGATIILGETVEWLGAEHLLARRARTPEIGARIVDAVARREAMAVASGKSLTGNNPGEENIRGGLSTIEEKALGAVAKSGSRPIDGIIGIAERPAGGGLWLMDGPFFSPESLTGFAAAGAQMMLFTTGAGNSVASAVAPTIKITARHDTVERLPQQIDFDASPVVAGGETSAGAAARLLARIRDVAGGTLTYGEILGEGLEVLSRVRGSL
jgi:altronate dehydratase large subunit